MSYKHVVHRCLLLSLVVLLCSSGLWADSSTDPCNSAPSACSATCSSSPCQVSVARNGNSLTLSYNGTDASTLCASNYSTVKWATSTSTASVVGLFFNPTHYPGSTSIVVGSSVIPASTAVAASNASQSCFVYSIVVCDSTGTCATVDPRVVITGVGVKGKTQKKHHE
jgi:hypothetical protein